MRNVCICIVAILLLVICVACSQSLDIPPTPTTRTPNKISLLKIPDKDRDSFDLSSPRPDRRGRSGGVSLLGGADGSGKDRDGGVAGETGKGTLLFLADAVQGMLNVCNPTMAFIRQEMAHAAESEVGPSVPISPRQIVYPYVFVVRAGLGLVYEKHIIFINYVSLEVNPRNPFKHFLHKYNFQLYLLGLLHSLCLWSSPSGPR